LQVAELLEGEVEVAPALRVSCNAHVGPDALVRAAEQSSAGFVLECGFTGRMKNSSRRIEFRRARVHKLLKNSDFGWRSAESPARPVIIGTLILGGAGLLGLHISFIFDVL
jgi:hypothetical protein